MPVIYAPLALWQRMQPAVSGASGTDGPPISAVAIQGGTAAAARIPLAVPGVEVGSRAAVIQGIPGYAQETSSLTMIQGFLVVIAALIVAAFFYVLTLQKTAQFGVLKVLGAGTAFLGRDLIGQVLMLTASAVAVGAMLAVGVAQILPSGIPFLLERQLVAMYGGILLAVALLGALISLRRIAAIDALTAIGRAD